MHGGGFPPFDHEHKRVRRRRRQLAKRGAIPPDSDRETREVIIAECKSGEHLCFYCGERPAVHAEHIHPLSKGGPEAEWNLWPACAECNGAKWTFPFAEFIERTAEPQVELPFPEIVITVDD